MTEPIEYERDYWQEYKDDLAMGYIYPDGSQREPDEPDPPYPPEWTAEDTAPWNSLSPTEQEAALQEEPF